MKRSITVAVCLDNDGGMTIFGRRQSRDRVLIDELCESVEGKIYVNVFSAFLFKDKTDRIVTVENPLAECPDGGVVFVENLRLAPYADEIDRIILYKWNTSYPYDAAIDISFEPYKVKTKKNFVGSSHDKITKLVLERRESGK